MTVPRQFLNSRAVNATQAPTNHITREVSAHCSQWFPLQYKKNIAIPAKKADMLTNPNKSFINKIPLCEE